MPYRREREPSTGQSVSQEKAGEIRSGKRKGVVTMIRIFNICYRMDGHCVFLKKFREFVHPLFVFASRTFVVHGQFKSRAPDPCVPVQVARLGTNPRGQAALKLILLAFRKGHISVWSLAKTSYLITTPTRATKLYRSARKPSQPRTTTITRALIDLVDIGLRLGGGRWGNRLTIRNSVAQ